METHHKLRRDPNWHPSACNICGQMGHQAANCTNGNTINWRQIYGDEAFILKAPIYWSEIVAARKAKAVDFPSIEKQAKEYAQRQAVAQGLDYDEMMRKAAELNAQDPKELIKIIEPPKVEEEAPLPAGWGVAKDAAGKSYFWHKKTQKTMWERPTADTPTS